MLASDFNRRRHFFACLELLLLLAGVGSCTFLWGFDAGLILLLVTILTWVIYVTSRACYYQLAVGRRLQDELGFKHTTCYLGKCLSNTLMFESITPGGLFHNAGFRDKDILLDDLSLTEFFELLEKQRGGEPIMFSVASWSDFQVNGPRYSRSITLQIAK